MDNHDQRVAPRLLEWYETRQRDLPWRRSSDPYRVWLSEVMLQQTRVETVMDYYRRFLEKYPTIESLADAREEHVLALWSGLGYYRRARSLLEGARLVVKRHRGRFPRTLPEALAVPGVGPYTAAAILSIAYGEPHPVVDGNVERVVTRLERIEGQPKRARVARRIRELAGSWLPLDRPGDFNQALMELGATLCSPIRPRCPECPLTDLCQAHLAGEAERYPQLPAKKPTVDVELEVGLLRKGRRYLLERAENLGYLEGLWVFPLLEITAPARSPSRGGRPRIARALEEKLGVRVKGVRELRPLRHAITFRRITLRPVLLETTPTDIRGKKGLRWARLRDLGTEVPVSSICLKIARRLEEEGGGAEPETSA